MASPTVREQLLTGTLAYLASGSARDLSVRAIAAASGRSTMCVYSKFGSRDALLAAVFDEASRDLLTVLESSSGADESVDSYSAWAHANPGLYQMLFEHDLTALGIDDGRRRSLIGQVLSEFARHEHPRPLDEGAALWSATHGAVVLARVLSATQTSDAVSPPSST